MSKIQNPTKVITGVNTRWSYANVWDPKSINGGAPKYSVSLIIPKSDTVTVNKIKAAIQAAYEEGESKLKGTSKVSQLRIPLEVSNLYFLEHSSHSIQTSCSRNPGMLSCSSTIFPLPQGHLYSYLSVSPSPAP